MANASGGANVLWLTEWLTTALDLRPGMRVLDLGCGRATSSIFLRREFGVQAWAVDLWFSASENIQRIRDAGVEDGVFPLHADARSLPFAEKFFDAIVCVDSFFYFGTDDLYLNYLAHFVKPGGQVAVAGAGLVREFAGPVPDHLRDFWTQDLWALHSAPWLRRHWERTGIVDVELAEDMPDGWRFWLDWQRAVAPDNTAEIAAVETLARISATCVSSVAAGKGHSWRNTAGPMRCARFPSNIRKSLYFVIKTSDWLGLMAAEHTRIMLEMLFDEIENAVDI